MTMISTAPLLLVRYGWTDDVLLLLLMLIVQKVLLLLLLLLFPTNLLLLVSLLVSVLRTLVEVEIARERERVHIGSK
jgi:hypothetical protein